MTKGTGYLDPETKQLEVWGLCIFNKHCTQGSKSQSRPSEEARFPAAPRALWIAALRKVIPGPQLYPKASQGSWRADGAVPKLQAQQSLTLIGLTTLAIGSSRQQQIRLKPQSGCPEQFSEHTEICECEKDKLKICRQNIVKFIHIKYICLHHYLSHTCSPGHWVHSHFRR